MTLTKKERAIKKFEASMNRLDLLGEELTLMMTDENYVENARNSRQERMEKMKKRREEGKLKPVARVKDINNPDEKLSLLLNEFKSKSPSSVQDIKDLTNEDFKQIRSLVSKMKKYSS